nr:putative nuclease HARBI1 [Onthophagus taurus]
MNELLIETCAVVSSVFGAILAQRINRLAKSKEKRKKRRWWVRKWILQRKSGTHNLVDGELRSNYTEDFKNLLRMSEAEFDYLLERVSPLISKSDTNMRQAVNAKTKLTVTLRYLATGDSFKSLEFLFRVPKNTISKFIPETCEAIHKTLREFIQVPATSDEWKNVESGFRQRWNFPGCVGALDGKHIVIRAPTATGSDYYNYKNSFSIVLMALADSDYCFLYVDVGAKGRGSDGGIFQNSSLYKAFETNYFAMPNDFLIVGDDAFPLKTYLMKPYSRRNMSQEERIYNYRLSRARRVVENTFGILVSKFRVFEKAISLKLQSVEKIVLACCTLHNWLRKTNPTYISRGLIDYEDENHGIFPGSWRQENISGLQNLPPTAQRHPQRQAQQIRDKYRDYFNNEGTVPWQRQLLNDMPNAEL